jgi:metal-responsive CopG/Arc/MetJ family transcriptional regulator
MKATKARISVTIMPDLARLLEEIAELENVSKSEIVERSLKEMMDDRMAKDARALAAMTFDDLPSEDEWLQIQNEALLNEAD